MSTVPIRKFYSVAEAAELTGFKRGRLLKAVRDHELAAIRPNGMSRNYRIEDVDLWAWIDRSKTTLKEP